MHMTARNAIACQRGFSLVEVMVSVIVIAAGLLGVAKMQALALASTNVASKRSLAAIEAASLASTMHENRAYWTSAAPAAADITVTGKVTGTTKTITISDGTLAAAKDCTTAAGNSQPCNPSALAAYDVQDWARSLQALLTTYTATISCPVNTPPSCRIQITWGEKAVALNDQEATAQAAAGTSYLQAPTYTLYVEP
jgi:type IV pilus assembly protein PilV